MIYLSKREPGAPRYIAEQRRGSRLVWWESRTGKEADLRPTTYSKVPRNVRRQIARARYKELDL